MELLENTDPLLREIAEKVYAGTRISVEEGVMLYEKAETAFLGILANFVREKKNGQNTYFNKNFHIEPTNVCLYTCNFCAYSQQYKNREDGWELSAEQMLNIVKSYEGQAVTEVHIVGGVHPKLDLYFFCKLISDIKLLRPDLHVKAFTAVELDYMFRKAKLTNAEGLQILKDAGLNSLPGGGAEIFDAEVREQICVDKANAKEWMDIHETAHTLGIPSNATMLYGHIENARNRINHMEELRQLQDRTDGFNTFIPLKFRNKNNDMSHLAEVSVIEDLRNYAVSRIYLDNFDHIKAYWPMIGRNTAMLSLSFGVDDIDGTIDDTTKIYSMAGAEDANPSMSTSQLADLILQAGRKPIERDTLYNVVKEYELSDIQTK